MRQQLRRARQRQDNRGAVEEALAALADAADAGAVAAVEDFGFVAADVAAGVGCQRTRWS